MASPWPLSLSGVQQGWFFAWCQIYIKIYLGVRGGASRPLCSNVDLMGYLVQRIYCKVLQFLVLMSLPMTAAIALCVWGSVFLFTTVVGMHSVLSLPRSWNIGFVPSNVLTETAVAQWLTLCATNRKVAGSIRDGVIGIFLWHNPSGRTMALGSIQPLTEMSTRSISWG